MHKGSFICSNPLCDPQTLCEMFSRTHRGFSFAQKKPASEIRKFPCKLNITDVQLSVLADNLFVNLYFFLLQEKSEANKSPSICF